MNLVVIYDDSNYKSDAIRDVIGNRGFGDVVVKRKRLEQYYKEKVLAKFHNLSWKHIHSVYEYNELVNEINTETKAETRYLHCFSDYVIVDDEKVLLTFEKILYIDEPYVAVFEDNIALILFDNSASYLQFLNNVCKGRTTLEAARDVEEKMPVEGMLNIGRVSNFIQCLSGNFDARYFNSIQGNNYTLTKSSHNKKKLKSEYTYYYLLPDDMKPWFVMPFNYQEDNNVASYTMERLHMTDLAIKWVHGSIDPGEMEMLLDKYFYFFNLRHSKAISDKKYDSIRKKLYVDKVLDRVSELKQKQEYQKIGQLLKCNDIDIDAIVEHYLSLKDILEKKVKTKKVSVIGHGDPCFANALYNKATQILKFIDPKGALTEDELWTDPYYDVAKLSHSICGRYDFFNNGLFDIKIDTDFKSVLEIDFDNSEYKNLFRKKLEENGYNYNLVRIYEVSLFISMLPLHIDYPHKVYGFILNAIDILKEIEISVSRI